ncbi:MAG: hypothetical protein HRU16_02415 [Planctomycetes bacterium]|nr:hypothetical protein [Planctomycetota bacterium]
MRGSKLNPGGCRKILYLVACAGICLHMAGCSGQQLRDRARDFGDTLRWRVGAGVGLYSEVQVTSWIHPAVGFADANLSPRYTIGWDPRPGQPAGALRTAAFPTLLVAFPFYQRYWENAGFGDQYSPKQGLLAAVILMGNHYVEGESCSMLRLHRNIPNPMLKTDPQLAALSKTQRHSRNSWIAISGTLGVLTFDAGINPLEIFDAITGLVSIDLLGDDDRGAEDVTADREQPRQADHDE